MPDDRPRFRVVDANASAEEVAAIVAALTLLTPAGAAGETSADSGATSRWVAASRLASRRSGSSRGEWRLSGRIGRRARA